jgi:hypothetical protein
LKTPSFDMTEKTNEDRSVDFEWLLSQQLETIVRLDFFLFFFIILDEECGYILLYISYLIYIYQALYTVEKYISIAKIKLFDMTQF